MSKQNIYLIFSVFLPTKEVKKDDKLVSKIKDSYSPSPVKGDDGKSHRSQDHSIKEFNEKDKMPELVAKIDNK